MLTRGDLTAEQEDEILTTAERLFDGSVDLDRMSGAVRSYLRKVLRNVQIDSHRRTQRRPETTSIRDLQNAGQEPLAAHAEPLDIAVQKEGLAYASALLDVAKQVLQQLNDQDSLIFSQRFFEHPPIPFAEIADALGHNEPAVRMRYYRVRDKVFEEVRRRLVTDAPDVLAFFSTGDNLRAQGEDDSSVD